MQPLDRLFATLSYPWDVLLPSAVWLMLCAAAIAGLARLLRRRGHPAPLRALRPGLWLGLADMALWVGLFLARTLNEGEPVSWLGFVSTPYALARSAVDALLWQVVGVSGAIDHEQLFRGFMHWDGRPLVLLAALLNEAALVALVACAVLCAAWRPRKASV
jgi:hypothetical protein